MIVARFEQPSKKNIADAGVRLKTSIQQADPAKEKLFQ